MSTMQYEDLQAKIETQETPESHLLLVSIPDGFTRGDIGAKVEYDFERVRIFGERSIGYNKFRRFNEKYQVPSYCDIGNIKGRFEGNTIIITMPKIPGKAPKQEPETTEQQAQETQPKEGNDKEGIPPQSATGDDQEKATAAAAEVKDQKGQEGTSDQDPKSTVESKEDHETSTPPEVTQESMPKKDQEETSQKAQVTEGESKGEADHKISTPPEASQESMPQKGQEETSQKDQVTKVQSKGEADHEITSTPPEATQESMPQKGQQGISHEATVTRDAKLQTEENTEQRVGKEDTKDHPKKIAKESGKPPVVDDTPTPEKESREESKGSATVESFPPKNAEKEKGKEISGKFGDDAEKKSDKKAIPESTRTRIKDMVASTTQAVTSLAKSINEDDKQKLIYTGAAIVVVALGVYASYKYRSSRRP